MSEQPIDRLGQLLAAALPTNHPAMHDWALIGMELKRSRNPWTKITNDPASWPEVGRDCWLWSEDLRECGCLEPTHGYPIWQTSTEALPFEVITHWQYIDPPTAECKST